MNEYKTFELFGYSIFTSKLDQIDFDSKCVINTLNQYSYMIAEQDPLFKEALLNSDILLPDGVGILAASTLIKGKKIAKIAGYDMHKFLLNKLDEEKGKCFYLGSSDSTLNKIKERIAVDYPNINIEYFSPPFKTKFSKEENDAIIDRINLFKPNVLFVGMTAPKQEKWIYEHKGRLNVNILCSIGAVFDFYAGTIKRPRQFWIDIGMEWIVRLKKEPKRMWKRYLYYGPIFISKILKMKLQNMFKGENL
jgi:N-acetylglucosaminyldiphosphoundecaprenol N-acetyl-beta-D-mannosaminyltransferase